MKRRDFVKYGAALGTAFTPAQVTLLKRYTDELITAFDADPAGESATLRGLEVLVASGLRVRRGRGRVLPDFVHHVAGAHRRGG